MRHLRLPWLASALIDDRNLRSKPAFAFTMMLFTLADTGERDNLALITIPAQ